MAQISTHFPINEYALENFFADCRKLKIPVTRAGFEDYLRDESRFQGQACGLVRARHEREVLDLIKLANRWNVSLTVVSGKTSLTGASVPLEGIVLDVKELDRIDPDDVSQVGPGAILRHYKDEVEGKGFFYPPDPSSEENCTIGGNVATNASGALSYFYGPTRNYIRGLRIALPTGAALEIERGEVISTSGVFKVPRRLMSPKGDDDLVIPVPKRGARPWNVCKNAAGLFSSEPMDLVDLFIGSEGILGVILNIKTHLLPRRKPFFALMLYIPSRERAVDLVLLLDNLRSGFANGRQGLQVEAAGRLAKILDEARTLAPELFRRVVPSCMEWFGSSVTSLLSPNTAAKLRGSYGGIYVEQEYLQGEDPLERASQWANLVEMLNRSLGPGERPIETDVALDAGQIRKMRQERLSVPEKLNELIRPGMVKIGLDFAVPINHLGKLLQRYDEILPHGKSYVFGHIGNAHLHANILPESQEEAERCREIARQLAGEVCELGGSVSGEHGIGKLKHDALEMMLGKEHIEEIIKVKRTLDPRLILNIGNMVRP